MTSGRLVRRLLGALALVLALTALVHAGPAGAATTSAAASAQQSAVSKQEAITQLGNVRTSIDETLRLLKASDSQESRDAAFEQARSGYLDHFELVEIPLRVVDPALTVKAEAQFAEIRELIRDDGSVDEVRTQIIALRGIIDDAERRLTDVGIGAPALVVGQSFLIIFREGLEVVLLLSVLLGYLEASKATQYRRPILIGVALAGVLTVLTVVALQTVFAQIGAGREVLEAVVSLVAVAMLFWVSFWLISRLDHKRWLEFVKARVWSAVAVGSTMSLVLIGFTAVYREGFETALIYQALLSFGTGLTGYIALGFGLGVAALTVVAFFIFRLGRRLPMRTFLSVAVVLVMLTSVAFLGNAVHELQAADMIGYTALDWPRMPIFLAEATGYWPTVQTITAQLVLLSVYVLGAVYMFVIKPGRERAASRRTGRDVGTGSGSAADAGHQIPVERRPDVSTVPAGGRAATAPGA
ncbi:MAG: FTR1 family iron permease [Acidimicrobiales bacterium]